MKRKLFKVGICLLLVLTLVACVPKKRVVVVTSYPAEYLVRTLAGDSVYIERLDVGSNPQTSQLREDYQEILKKADVLFYISELQPYWEVYRDEIVEGNRKIELIDFAEMSSLHPFKRYTTVQVDGSNHVLESEYYDSASFANVDKYAMDPFLWMDPLATTSMARTVRDWLVKQYPDDASAINARYDKLEMDLTYLQADYFKLKDMGNIKMVTMTPTFGNWQKSFGISVYPVSISKYGVLPDEAMLNDIRSRIEMDDVKYIVYEDNMTEEQTKLFNQLKTEMKLTEIKLSNIFTLTDGDINDNQDYITKMYQNLETLEATTQ